MPVFLFTDIESSTQLWEKYSQPMGPIMVRHDTILSDLIGQHGGRVIRHRGDGVSAVFESGDPLGCALAVQRRFTGEDWGEIGGLSLRLALHAGQAERREFSEASMGQKEEYFGPVLNRTARILDTGWGGQILLTPEVLAVCSLPAEADWQDLGVHLLKSLETPQPIYGLLHPDLGGPFPPLRSLVGAITPLPPCPYRGLFAFAEADAPFFFGRETVTARLVEAVQQQSLVAVIGPSGSGKSSLVFAGLLPHLRKSTIHHPPSTIHHRKSEIRNPKSEIQAKRPKWLSVVFRPGRQPLYQLAAGLAPLLKPHLSETGHLLETRQLADALRQGQLSLADIVAQIGQKNPDIDRFLLIIDQFEELYTLCPQPQTRHRFLEVILAAAEGQSATNDQRPPTIDDQISSISQSHAKFAREATNYQLPISPSPNLPAPLAITLTLRADFMGQALTYRPLAVALQDAALMLGPLTPQELAQVIVKPAQQQGIAFESGLVERILTDVGDEPGQLALLQFALLALWQHQASGKLLTHTAYEAIGRVEGALTHYADEVYGGLAQVEQTQARGIFIQMVQPGEGTEDTRRLTTSLELGQTHWPLVQRLAEARLLMVSRDPVEGHKTAELVHEALIRGWTQLRTWLETDRGFRLWQERLRVALRQWEASRLDEGALLRGVLLTEAETWATNRGSDLTALEQAFIQASLALRDEQRLTAEAQHQRELAQVQRLAEAEHQRAEAERQRAETQTRASRRLGWLVAGLSVIFLLALVAASLAFTERQEAQRQTVAAQTERGRAEAQAQRALSLQLAAQATNQVADRLDLALLLSLEANRVSDTPESRGSLLTSLESGSRLTTYWRQHPAPIWSIAFSPDGQTLASGGADETIILWDATAASGQPLGPPLVGHTAAVNSLAFSPDGQTLASASADETIILWDAATKQPRGVPLKAHTNWVTALVFSPDGRTLASASYDHTIILWDATAATSQPLGPPLTGHTDWVVDLAFSPDGQTLASASFDGTIILWDVARREMVYPPLTGHSGAVSSVAFEPNEGHILASAGHDKTVRLWDVTTGQVMGAPLTGHTDIIESIAFSPAPAGRKPVLASAGADQTIILWDIVTGEPLEPPLRGHTAAVTAVAFSPNGQTLLSAGQDNTIIVWNMVSRRRLGQPLTEQNAWVWDVTFSPDGRLLASASADHTITLWDMAARQPQGEPLTGHTDAVAAVAFSPDGQTLASASYDKTIILWDATAATHQPLAPPLTGHTGPVTDLAFSLDGQTLLSASQDKTIRRWDATATTQQPLGPALTNHTDRVSRVAFSPAGEGWASGSFDRTVLLWDTATNRPHGLPLSQHADRVWSMAFNPTGSLLATGSWREIALWDLTADPPSRQTLAGHASWVNDLAFSPAAASPIEGQLLASAGEDGTLILWDVAARQPLGQLTTGHTAKVLSVAFSPDGQTLASSGADGAIILWEVAFAAWQSRACRIANRNLTPEEWGQYLGDEPYRVTCPKVAG